MSQQPKTYHIALVKGYTPRTRHTVYLQARRNLDLLSCEAWKYLGERITTKAALKAIAPQLLDMINAVYKTNFVRIVID